MLTIIQLTILLEFKQYQLADTATISAQGQALSQAASLELVPLKKKRMRPLNARLFEHGANNSISKFDRPNFCLIC